MKKFFLILGIIIFMLMAISSCVASKSITKEKETQNKKIVLLFAETEQSIKAKDFQKAQINLEKILDIDIKNEEYIALYDCVFALSNNIDDFSFWTAEFSKDELDKAREGNFYKEYTKYEEINQPLNEKINSYARKNYKKILKQKNDAEKLQKKFLEEQEKNERIRKFVTRYDNDSYKPLVDYVKQNMNDPKSFEHVRTSYDTSRKDTVKVMMEFRGKNAFGALVINTCSATAVIDTGELLEVKCN